MSDPRRLLEEHGDGEGAALMHAVLRSARGEMAPPHAKQHLLEALELGEASVSAVKTSASRPGPRAPVEKRTMFDSILNRGNVAKSRFGTGAAFSTAVHVALLGLAIYIGSRPADTKKKDVSVTFVQAAAAPPPADAPPPPPPPPPPKRRSSTPKVEKVEVKDPEVVKKPDTIVEAKEEAAEKPVDVAEVTPKGGDDDDGGQEGGVEGGVKGGVVGGVLGGKLGSTTPVPQPQNQVIPFGAGMNRPSMVAGRDPTYTKEALAARVEGLMIVRCTITTSGAISNCRVIKEVPHMKQAVLDALYSRRYTPVVFNGVPVNVDYVFNIKLVLPNR
jgi:periplasmic protein TonB